MDRISSELGRNDTESGADTSAIPLVEGDEALIAQSARHAAIPRRLFQLDELDHKLIRLLRLNGRRPNSELAAEVGLSASACLRRIRILEDRGVIRGYTAIVDSPGAQDGMIAIVRLTLEKQTEEYLRRFETAVRDHPEIEECFLMTGDADYVLRVSAPSAAPSTRPTVSIGMSSAPMLRWRILQQRWP